MAEAQNFAVRQKELKLLAVAQNIAVRQKELKLLAEAQKLCSFAENVEFCADAQKLSCSADESENYFLRVETLKMKFIGSCRKFGLTVSAENQ